MKRTFVAVVLLGPALARGDWPQWRGPGRDGGWLRADLPEKFTAELKPRWRKPIGGGFSGIAVTGGRVYAFDYQAQPREQERVLCLDAKTGATLWTHGYDVAYQKMDYGNGPRSTPTVHEGRVYTFGARGHLCCLDVRTGKEVWRRDTVKDFKGRIPTWGHACSPLVDGKRLIVQVGGVEAGIVAFDLDTGKELWRSLADRPGYASPILIAGKGWRQLVCFQPEHVVGLEPETGKELWRIRHEPIDYDVAISDAVWHEGILLTGDYWTGCRAIALDEKGQNPKVIWKGKQVSLLMSTPLWRDGHAYALDRHRGLKCIELKSGKINWQDEHVTPRGRNPQASLVWAGERALIFNEKCELILARLTPEKYEELSRAAIPLKKKSTWAHPGYADGCIFARDDEEIVCVPLTRGK
jgi:outer membrane protein assembly factor BamB